MQRPVVVLTDQSIGAEARARLEPLFDVRMLSGQYPAEVKLIEACADAQAILARLATITGRVIAAAPRLRIIARHGVGVDAVDLAAATRRGVAVTTTGAANAAAAIQRADEARRYAPPSRHGQRLHTLRAPLAGGLSEEYVKACDFKSKTGGHLMTPISRRRVLQSSLAAPAALAMTRSTSAQTAASDNAWLAKPVHIVLPFGAGGAADTVARVLFAKVAERLKQSFVIENKTGGNTMVASSAALQAPKDGYTFLANSSQFLINPIAMKNLPFDFATSFVPVSRLAAFPQVVAVRRDFPAKTIYELLTHAKANPGKIGFGTPPAGGMAHMAGALIQHRAGVRFNHAPYRLATEAVRDVGGGNLDMVILTTSTIQPALQSNSVRILAVISAKRSAAVPDAPTLAETAMPSFDMDDWIGLFAATGVPQSIINQMQAALADAARDPDVVARLTPLGTVILADTAQAFGKFLDGQRTVLTALIKDTGITLE